MHPSRNLALALVCTIIASGCGKGPATTGPSGTSTPRVRFIALSQSRERSEIEALGSLVYFEKADVGSNVEGRIDLIHVKEGQQVYRGQPLARVEQLPFTIALQNARTELVQARTRLNIATMQYQDAVRNVHKQMAAITKSMAEVREKQLFLQTAETKLQTAAALYQADGMTKSAYEDAKTSVESAKVALTVAEKNLKMVAIGYQDEDLAALGHKGPFTEQKRLQLIILINTTKEKAAIASAENDLLKANNNHKQAEMLFRETVIRSPLTGVVAMKGIDRGELVKKDTKLFTVMDVTRMFATLNLSEDSLVDIEQSGSVPVSIDSLGGLKMDGTISLVHPLVDPRSRSVTIKVLLANHGGRLKPGMFVRAGLRLKQNARAWLLPAAAVMGRKDNAPFVYALAGKTIFKKTVVIGRVRGENIEILKGLEASALVAVPPEKDDESELSVLADGNPVIPVLPDGTKLQDAPAPGTTNTKSAPGKGGS